VVHFGVTLLGSELRPEVLGQVKLFSSSSDA